MQEELHKQIYSLWLEGYSYKEIAQMSLSASVSKKRIRNIVCPKGRKTDYEFNHAVCRLFRLKFLEFGSANEAITWIYENQPERQLSEKSIRRIVNKQRGKKN